MNNEDKLRELLHRVFKALPGTLDADSFDASEVDHEELCRCYDEAIKLGFLRHPNPCRNIEVAPNDKFCPKCDGVGCEFCEVAECAECGKHIAATLSDADGKFRCSLCRYTRR